MISYSSKNNFFDRKKIVDLIGKAGASALSKIGAFVQRRAKSSMRRRKKPSQPGTPPSVHQGDLKRFIWFAYDSRSKSVVIGPMGFNQKFLVGGSWKGGTVPSLQEFGGTAGIREVRLWPGGPWRTKGRRGLRPGQVIRVRHATFPKRPFMGPALEKERQAGTIPSAWANSIKGP